MTREELLNIIETDHVQCGEAATLARMALAAMDSEPVAWVVGSDEIKEFNRGREVMVMRDCDDEVDAALVVAGIKVEVCA